MLCAAASTAFAGPDGIDVLSVTNTRIDHVFVTATDDALCIKARNFDDAEQDPDPARDNRNIITTNAVVYQVNYRATKFGTETAAALFEDILYENIYVARAGTNQANTIFLADSAEVRNIVYRNFYAPGNNWAASIEPFGGRPMWASARIHQITLRNFVGNVVRFSGSSTSDYLISDSVVTNFWRQGSITTDPSHLTLNAYVDAPTITLNANPVYALDFAFPVESSRHMRPSLMYIEAEVRHDDGLPLTVEFFADGVSIGTATSAPYAIEWDAPDGWHNLTFAVTDANGNSDTLATPRRVEVRSDPVFSAIRIFPGSPEIGPNLDKQFTARALDQYGETFYPQPTAWTWSADSGGTFADPASGLLTAASEDGGPHTVRVSATVDGTTVEGTTVFTITSELNITDMFVASGKAYVWDILEVGALRYIDRTVTFSSVGVYGGKLYLRNSNDDKNREGTMVSFRVNLPVTVWIAVANDFDRNTPWFADYTSTGTTLNGFEVFSRFFQPGMISLGDNGGAQNVYHVVLDYTPPPPNQPPVANLAANPLAGDPPMLVNFDASGSSDPDGHIVRYDWDFGDGTVIADGNAQEQHTYLSVGTFTASVTVTDNEGESATASVFVSTTGVPNIPLVFMFNFGSVAYDGTNSPAHAEGRVPSDINAWQTMNAASVTQTVEVGGVSFSATAEFRRADGTGADAAVNLAQTSSTGNRSGTGTGIFGTALTQSWRSYQRGGNAGRSVGAFFTGLEPGEYDVYAVVHNPVLIAAGRTTNVGIGVGSATSGSLAWNHASLTGTSFAASPQTDTWELGVNYAKVRVEVTAANPNIYVIQGGPAAANDEFDFHTLTAVQIVAVQPDPPPPPPDAYADWAAANDITGGPTDETGGVANLIRYALGGTASTPASELTPQLQSHVDGSGLSLSLTFYRIDDPQITYKVWYSEDLSNWVSIWEAQGAHNGTPGLFEVSHPTTTNRGFLRLEVSR